MTPENLNELVISPALQLLGPRFVSRLARIELIAIARQESFIRWRRQQPFGGPAKSFWQFEAGGGVKSVLTHPVLKPYAERVLAELNYPPVVGIVHDAMADNDLLAACMARLLLFSDPRPLPATPRDGWTQYVENWRPGKPHPEAWAENYRIAAETVAAWERPL